MEIITEVVKAILEQALNFKKQLIAVAILLVVLFAMKTVVPIVMEARANQTPITSISAENSKVYSVSSELSASDFTVKATHEDGKVSTLDTSEFSLSRTSLRPVGDTTKVTIYLGEDKNITCDVDVNVKREKVLGFKVGYPEQADVTAVLYSNGELCFEGTGDVMVFEDGEYPWIDYENSDENPILSVSFEDTVTPTNMDYWFSNCKTLTYVSPIPTSVKSLVETFKNCTNLKRTANWENCNNLLNINYAYSGCSSLTETSPIPSSVRTARSAFEDCISLESTADMSNATDLQSAISMYEGCQSLNTVIMCPAPVYIDSMLKDCINLKKMPNIPDTVKSMSKAFSGDTSLIYMSTIPASAEDISSCLEGCPYLEGDITIDCNASAYSGMFSGSAVATDINLIGKSKVLDIYAGTADYGNVTVNGKQPNAELSFSDIIKD